MNRSRLKVPHRCKQTALLGEEAKRVRNAQGSEREKDTRWEIEGTGHIERERERVVDVAMRYLTRRSLTGGNENGGVTRRAGLRSEEQKRERELTEDR